MGVSCDFLGGGRGSGRVLLPRICNLLLDDVPGGVACEVGTVSAEFFGVDGFVDLYPGFHAVI